MSECPPCTLTCTKYVQVRNVGGNADESIKDPMGHPLPPCIVMERGESLDIWAERAKPDRSMAFTARLVSANVTRCWPGCYRYRTALVHAHVAACES